MRNAVQRRNHRERAQPAERSKWGLLEKPKDYKLRAADHKTKKRKIKSLQQKASERNEDEFYFGMVNGETKNGVRVTKRGEENSGGGGKVLKRDVVQLMKTQDVGYLRTVLQQTRKERQRMEEDVVGGDVAVSARPSGTKTGRKVFGENGEDLVTRSATLQPLDMDVDDWMSDEESDGDESVDENLSVEEQRKRKKLEVRRRKLGFLKDRERDLTTALREVEDQRAKMNGSTGGVSKKGTKFKVRERKK